MASSERRGMDWPTAWRALLLVYALAVLLHIVYPLFAVPVWALFVIYAPKVLTGARLVRDPWGGRASPRIYLIAFVPLLAVALVTFALLSGTPQGDVPPLDVYLVYAMTVLFALSLAAVYMVASAPPTARARRGLLGLSLLAQVVSAFTQSTLLTAFVPLGPTQEYGLAFFLSIASFLALFLADWIGREQTTAVARRVRRG